MSTATATPKCSPAAVTAWRCGTGTPPVANSPSSAKPWWRCRTARGYGAASHYLTIQTALIDGDTKADLLARAADGLHSYRWTGTAWTEMGPVLGLSDAAGWAHPQYYETITTGDVNGTGRAQLLARGPAGLEVRRWDNGWQSDGPTLTDLSDAAGFTDRSRYATMDAADLDGAGPEEVLARAADGISVWRRSAPGGAWTRLSAASPALADDPWSKAQHYETIQTVEADATAGEELIGRGPYGVRTFAYATEPAGFTRPQPFGEFPAFAGEEAKAYAALGRLLLNRDTDFRKATYASPAESITEGTLDRYRTQLAERCDVVAAADEGAVPPTYTNCRPPRDSEIDPVAWTAVTNQIIAELWAAAGVVAHFSILDNTLTKLFQDQQGILPALDSALKLPPRNPGSKAPTFLKLIKSALEIGGDVFQFFDTAKKYPRVVRSIALTAHSLGAVGEALGLAKTPSPPQTYAQITEQVARNQQLQRDIASAQRRYVLADYGLSRTVGSLVNGRLLTIDETAMLSAGRQGFARWAYELFLPAYWNRYHAVRCHNFGTDSYCNLPNYPPFKILETRRNSSYTDYDFLAVLPNESYCKYEFYVVYSFHECIWYDPGEVGARAWGKPGPECQYDPTPGSTAAWRYGCPTGLDPKAMVDNRDGFNFPQVYCPVQENTSRPCRAVGAASAASGRLSIPVNGRANLSMSGRLPATTVAELGRGSVTLERFLHEDPDVGAGELLSASPGRELSPVELRRVPSRRRGVSTYTWTPPRAEPDLPRRIVLRIDTTSRRRQPRFDLQVRGVRVERPHACAAGENEALLETRLGLPMDNRQGRLSTGITARWRCDEDRTGALRALRLKR